MKKKSSVCGISMKVPSGCSRDSISLRGAGIISVLQQSKGARFTLDSLLLADFCRIKARDRVLEPGTGTGIVSLLLAKKNPCTRITAIEMQPALVRICRRNIVDNGLADRITLIRGDLRSLEGLQTGSYDVIVANPPYTQAGSGKQNPGYERLASRQDGFGDLGVWLDLQRYLKNRGSYVAVFPAGRIADLFMTLRSHRLEPKQIRLVHAYHDRHASLVLVEAKKNAAPGMNVLPPLIVHNAGGAYSPEIQDLYALS